MEDLMSTHEYIDQQEYHQAMMYDPNVQLAQDLDNELLMIKIELSFAKIKAKMWEEMYYKLENIRGVI
jgi:membrane peptidoglycan carboxypeptidase